MKFGRAKLPKIFHKNAEKKFKRKKNNNKELSSFENGKVNANFCYGGEKVFSLGKFSAVATECQGRPYPPSWFTKNTFFLEHRVRPRKPTMLQKKTITFNPTYLIKVTHISCILKPLNTESLVFQVLNIRFNIQSLHLWT